ncbi:MAG: anti-sigma regulatory factor [Myxococcales bacterium]|nr:anti-sigma regulatory factor [Myxococcales bacterium]
MPTFTESDGKLTLRVQQPGDVARAVLHARRLAEQAGFEEEDAVAIATAVSELATNAITHGGGGIAKLRTFDEQGRTCFQVEVEDRGPGIADPERAMQAHYSTAGTLGLGLPGVDRLMNDLHIEAMPGGGARVSARKHLSPPRGRRA